MESIHHHIEEEEGQVFPMTRKVLSQSVISDIARCVQDEKQRVMASVGCAAGPALPVLSTDAKECRYETEANR